jgi:hypothetical protein
MSPKYETEGDLTRHKSIYHDLYQPSQVRVPSSELALVRFVGRIVRLRSDRAISRGAVAMLSSFVAQPHRLR